MQPVFTMMPPKSIVESHTSCLSLVLDILNWPLSQKPHPLERPGPAIQVGAALSSTTHRQGKGSDTRPHHPRHQPQMTSIEPTSNTGNVAESNYSIISTRQIASRLTQGKATS